MCEINIDLYSGRVYFHSFSRSKTMFLKKMFRWKKMIHFWTTTFHGAVYFTYLKPFRFMQIFINSADDQKIFLEIG